MSEFAKLNQIISILGTIVTNQAVLADAVNAIPGTPDLQAHIDTLAKQVSDIQASIGSETDGTTPAPTPTPAPGSDTISGTLAEDATGVDEHGNDVSLKAGEEVVVNAADTLPGGEA